ncbi:hypothetical protein ACFOZ5_12480 [Marinobacter lacisalsi]|uniref:Uncharacterized protein n=1 Tax=Marinobacter lacisalsi TaxID=475979 RepID=A0ABV8QJ98_9GAMM
MINKALAFVAGCALAASASALELSKYPKAFAAPYGVSVIVAPVSEGDQALQTIRDSHSNNANNNRTPAANVDACEA